MLSKFKVENFKNFETELFLDLSSGRYNFNDFNIKNKVVKTAVVYGYNACGKSNLALAIFDIVKMLTDNNFDNSKYNNYQNVKALNKQTKFTYVFKFDNDEVEYQYEKEALELPITEKLLINGIEKVSINRSLSNICCIDLEGAQSLDKTIDNQNLSVVRYIKRNASLSKDNHDNQVFLKFYDFVDRMLLFWCLQNRNFIGYSSSSHINDIFEDIVKEQHLVEFNDFFKDAGLNKKIIVKKNSLGQTVPYYDFGNNHDLLCEGNMSNGESALMLFYYWFSKINNKKSPSLIFIDEFDAFYHVKLSKYLVTYLSKFNNLQIILTTHNPSLCSNEILRPDSYYLLQNNKISSFNNRTDKELRQMHNLERLFWAGAFENE